MESKYTPGLTPNVFRALDRDGSLRVLGLSLAANDLMVNLEALGRIPESENSYFFYTSVAIVREVAKLVASTERSTLSQKFSDGTWSSFKELVAVLAPFHDTSLVKSVLKPIRDVTFHYDHTQSSDMVRWDEILQRLCERDQIDVGLMVDNRSLNGQRYTFGEKVRSEYVSQFLTTEIVSRLSLVSVGIGVFVDSLLADLVQEQKRTGRSPGVHTP